MAPIKASRSTMRTFVAVDVPDRLTDRFASILSDLRRSGAAVRWVDPSGLHFTLKFLGDVDGNDLTAVDDVLRRVASRADETRARIRGVGSFPRKGRPRVVWVGIEPEGDRLHRLQQDVEAAMEELGFSPERRAYHPHVTLGRVKGGRNVGRLQETIDELSDVEVGDIRIREFVLFESRLTPRGARYSALSRYRLGGEY